jgi:hypothetical protein
LGSHLEPGRIPVCSDNPFVPRMGARVPEYVILDTTALWVDLRLVKLASKVLLTAAEEGEYVLVLPEVVRREAVNHRRREIRKLSNDIRSVQRRLSDLHSGFPAAYLHLEDEDALLDRYDSHLRSAIEGSGGRIESIPDVPHESLIEKALEIRKPFGEKGRGYRDALIWESVANLAASGEVALITNNHFDFNAGSSVDKDGTRALHDDLVADLRRRNIDSSNVVVYPDVETFVQHQITDELASWLLERAAEPIAKLWEVVDRHEDEIRDATMEYLLFGDWTADGIEIMSPHIPEEVNIGEVHDILETVVDEAEYHGPGTIEGTVVVQAFVRVTFQLEVFSDRERLPHPSGPFRENATVQVKLHVTWREDYDRLEIRDLEGPYGGYIEVYD